VRLFGCAFAQVIKEGLNSVIKGDCLGDQFFGRTGKLVGARRYLASVAVNRLDAFGYFARAVSCLLNAA